MKERGMLFSAPMVRALLDGIKTQTRRIMKPQPRIDGNWTRTKIPGGEVSYGSERQFIASHPSWCPYGHPGDRLWVRETFAKVDGQTQPWIETDYRATYTHGDRLGDTLGIKKRWTPAIHMPRAASRINLEITGVRVERLQDISEADAKAEGINCYPFRPDDGFPICDGYTHLPDDGKCKLHPTAAKAYRELWESINGPGSWDSNPWVWMIEFKRLNQSGPDLSLMHRSNG